MEEETTPARRTERFPEVGTPLPDCFWGVVSIQMSSVAYACGARVRPCGACRGVGTTTAHLRPAWSYIWRQTPDDCSMIVHTGCVCIIDHPESRLMIDDAVECIQSGRETKCGLGLASSQTQRKHTPQRRRSGTRRGREGTGEGGSLYICM